MARMRHKVVRIGEQYQIQRMFKPDGTNPVWITKRMGYPEKPGAFVQHRFLNQAIKDIRTEANGTKSVIILDQDTLKHLRNINFDSESIRLLVGNIEFQKEKNDAPTAIS